MKKSIFWDIVFVGLMIFHSSGAQDPQGCFLYDFQPKTAVIPPYEDYETTTASPTVTVTVNYSDTIGKVSKYLFGNNANPYMSQMVDQPVLLNHIITLSPNIIRFPGGNLSSIFFWNSSPGIPPSDAPDSLDNSDGVKEKAGYWYGKNTQSWTLSVDNYYNMLELTNNTGIITINYGYARYGTGPHPAQAAAGYAADWVRYDNGRTKFWEIGNESGGPWQAGFRIDTNANQDNQPLIVSGELYGEHFKIFVDSMKSAAAETGHEIFIGAQLIEDPDAENSWNPPFRDWNEGFFKSAGNLADFFIVHSYYTPYNENSTATIILNSALTGTPSMMNVVKSAATVAGKDMKPVALTEWNIFAIGSKQACSYINGIHAALVLGEMANQQFGMSSRWNLANGYDNGNDHGMFSQGDEPNVPKWNPRPAFFCMYFFQKFFGDHVLVTTVSESSDIRAYASAFSSGELGIIVVNKGNSNHIAELSIPGFGFGDRYYMYSITGGTDNGEFSQEVYVNGQGPDNLTGGPINDLVNIKARSAIINDTIKFPLPARSVQYIMVKNGDYYLHSPETCLFKTINVFPNPSSSIFNFKLPLYSIKLEVVDMCGRLVYQQLLQTNQETVELDLGVPPGIYLARIYAGNNVYITKLLFR